MAQQRVEALRPGKTSEFEFWSNTSGTVYLCRQRRDDAWQAIVDGDVVLDTSRPWLSAHLSQPVQPLTAPDVGSLVPLLALQENLHLLLDLDPQEITAPSSDAEVTFE